MSFMKTAKSSSILVILALPEQAFPINFQQTVVHKFLRDENIVRVIMDRQCVFDLENLVSCIYYRYVCYMCVTTDFEVATLFVLEYAY